MLIINADDWGKNETSTNNSLTCYRSGSITSASAMVFTADSQRAAELARQHGLETGLHLNFTHAFDGIGVSSKLADCQKRIAAFLRSSRYAALLYNPFLRKEFEYSYKAQYEEYVRLYNALPTHIDGHHHMHLCANMLVGRLIPRGARVRRNFTFFPNEKSFLNRFYRKTIDALLMRRYTCTDLFFSVSPLWDTQRLNTIVTLAKTRNVELMVHPERQEEADYLMTDEYAQMISDVKRRSYAFL